jgi:hypothetical protein
MSYFADKTINAEAIANSLNASIFGCRANRLQIS